MAHRLCVQRRTLGLLPGGAPRRGSADHRQVGLQTAFDETVCIYQTFYASAAARASARLGQDPITTIWLGDVTRISGPT